MILLEKNAWISLKICIMIVLNILSAAQKKKVLIFCRWCDITFWKSARMMSAQSWSRDWADVITGLSRPHPCRFSDGYISLSTKHYYISFLCSSKTVTIYIYAKIQAEMCMFTLQNSRGLNRAIWRPLWLMTSAAADVISVPSVYICIYYCLKKINRLWENTRNAM